VIGHKRSELAAAAGLQAQTTYQQPGAHPYST